MLIDFHSHTRLSDGEHELEEWVILARDRGYDVLGVTDHVTARRVEERVQMLVKRVEALGRHDGPRVIPGCEITRVAPGEIAEVVRRARGAGAQLVIVHGETPMDAPQPGVNRAAIEAGVDVLAHPGLIARADMERAAALGIPVEISGRKVHSLANGHVLSMARACGARVVIDSDSHAATDLFTPEQHEIVGRGAGMNDEEYAAARATARAIAERITGPLGARVA